MQSSFFLKLVFFILVIFFAFYTSESKRTPAPSPGPVKYEIIGKYIGCLVAGFSGQVSGNTTISIPALLLTKDGNLFGNVM